MKSKTYASFPSCGQTKDLPKIAGVCAVVCGRLAKFAQRAPLSLRRASGADKAPWIGFPSALEIIRAKPRTLRRLLKRGSGRGDLIGSHLEACECARAE